MDAALHALKVDISTCQSFENTLKGKPLGSGDKARAGKNRRKQPVAISSTTRRVDEVLTACISACQQSRKRQRDDADPPDDMSDGGLSQYTRFTDQIALGMYQQFLHYVPRLVNVLAEALPMPRSGITLPLDLSTIAARCKGSYYAPRRFAAVQLAYSSPRCRVLVFHTGRLVGTGTGGACAARLAIARAQLQLAREAGVHLHVRNFAVINSVGAVGLQATLNCDAFATDHSGESHFDRLPELLRYSSASELLAKIPDEMQEHHRIKCVPPEAAAPVAPRRLGRTGQYLATHRASDTAPQAASIWDGWGDAEPETYNPPAHENGDTGGIDFDALGL